MKRQNLVDGLLFVLLILAGAQVRVWLHDLPNFAPVAALALFAGYHFRSWVLAACVPLGVMALSDLQLGSYDPRMMALVYAALAAPVALRPVLQRYLALKHRPWAQACGALLGLISCSLAASVAFFLTTNFGVWLWFDLYERTWSGLLTCFVQAIPFFRYTLAGDLIFAAVLFGGYALATQEGLAPVLRSENAGAPY